MFHIRLQNCFVSVTVILTILLLVLPPSTYAGFRCADNHSCCSGISRFDERRLCQVRLGSYSCSCESSCVIRNNCCSDYQSYCNLGVGDSCVYSEWSAWTGCNVQRPGVCQTGVKRRTRGVLHVGNFNGNRCLDDERHEILRCDDDCTNHDMVQIMNQPQWIARNATNFLWRGLVEVIRGNCADQDNMICLLCSDPLLCEGLQRNDVLSLINDRGCVVQTRIFTTPRRRACPPWLGANMFALRPRTGT